MTMTIHVAGSASEMPYHTRGEGQVPAEGLAMIEGRVIGPDQVTPVAVRLMGESSRVRKVSGTNDFISRTTLERELRLPFKALRTHDEKVGGMNTYEFIKALEKTINHFVREVSLPPKDVYEEEIGLIARDWVLFYHYALFTHGDQPSMLRDFYRVALAGLCPLVWRGVWPRGFCIAYCPPHHPWATQGLPVSWQPSPEDLKLGSTKPKLAKPLALEVPDVAAAPMSEWPALATSPDPSAALIAWWLPWAETDTCREALGAVAERVHRIEVKGKTLRLHARGRFDDAPHIIEASAPFTGELKPMPRSAAELIRRHNGIAVITIVEGREHDREVLCPGYVKGRFPVEWDLWWTADPWKPDEPFMKPPLVPCADDQDVWVYHPHRLRAPGELELRRIDHETGKLREPLPYGAGGVILRILADILVPDVVGRASDFGLRND